MACIITCAHCCVKTNIFCISQGLDYIIIKALCCQTSLLIVKVGNEGQGRAGRQFLHAFQLALDGAGFA